MGKPSECSVWLVISMLVCSLPVNVTAQRGFISILCGGKTNYTDENNITWVTDANYIDVGQTASTVDASLSSYLQNQRFFPKPLKKACYQLPIASNVPYLIRAWFVAGNNDGYKTFFTFSVETLDMLKKEEMAVDLDPSYYEFIFVSSGRMLYVCLTRTSENYDPFINAIELRTLRDGMYGQARPGSLLSTLSREDVGGYYTFRYPQDKFDRIWGSYRFSQDSYASSLEPISANNTKNLPPTRAMQTARVTDQDTLGTFILSNNLYNSLLVLYFAEIQMLNMTESRSFHVEINGERRSDIITIVPYYTAMELAILCGQTSTFLFDLYRAENSTHGPILNAYEFYLIFDTAQATYQPDVEVLEAVKRRFHIKDWISDPCYLMEWEGIVCDNDINSSFRRILEINLSGRNLTGLVPEDFGRLDAIVSLSLNNNHLTGPLPNFSNLTDLERLHLQDNNLSGSVPEWLSHLKNLKQLYLQNNNLNGTVPAWLSELTNLEELNIENNNFSGDIPAQLLQNCSLKLNYSGNPYLRMEKRNCTLHNSKINNSKVVMGTTVGGILIIALGLIVGGVLYRNRFKRKKGVVKESGLVGRERNPFFNEDISRIMVPNPTKCRAFTLDEMTAATETFSREIGRGGFGCVFFGKLPEGTEIAVKVLSLFSHQGADEFLNEVDLLSRINHRNLVSLLGYCNETREVMLIYEHMSKGSLRDHLYGPTAKNSQLTWKTRLKIVLDAAQGKSLYNFDVHYICRMETFLFEVLITAKKRQITGNHVSHLTDLRFPYCEGLEYLHMGCTPKIIHRDIKTANILLDGNLDGKVADFGLSRMTMDGQATHVTTAVKGTFGYLDPEYYSTQMLTEKSDVYSFGVVLLEIICGRPPIDQKLAEEDVNIIRWATPYILDDDVGKITEIVDKALDGRYDMKSMTGVAKVAMRCVQVERSCRPSMTEVVAELKEAIKLEDIASASVSEEIGIEGGDLVESSKRKGMEWSDNSSNIPLVGR